MKTDNKTATRQRIATEMMALRESFEQLTDSVSSLLATMPDNERDILQIRWKITTESFEEIFNRYLK